MNTNLTFRCGCQRLLEVPANLAGMRVRCPACRSILVAPVADAVPVARLVDPPRPPPSRLTRPAIHAVSPLATPLSFAANVIAILGIFLFLASLFWILGAPFGVGCLAPPELVVLVTGALVLVVVCGSAVAVQMASPDFRPLSAAATGKPASPFSIGRLSLLLWIAACAWLVFNVRPSVCPRPPRHHPGAASSRIDPCESARNRLQQALASQSVPAGADSEYLARSFQSLVPCPCFRSWYVRMDRREAIVACPEHPSVEIRLKVRFSRTTQAQPPGTK